MRPREDLELTRLNHVKKRAHPVTDPLGPAMIQFFKKEVQKRQTKFTAIASAWNQVIPDSLLEHCCLESFSSGSLKVLVDNSSHLYQLKQLLLSGMEKQLKLAAGVSGLKKVNLKLGRWYEGDGVTRKLRFD